MEDLRIAVQGLILAHGPEKVKAAADALLQKSTRSIPAEHIPVLEAHKIKDTLDQLDAAVADVLEAGKNNEAAYKEKADLLRRRTTLENDVKITEAQAIMEIRGEARSQYVMVGSEKVALSNDQARDAYRRMASKDQRIELAKVEAEIAAIDVEIFKAKEKWNAAQEANHSIRAKAAVQAALLQFLA